MSELLKVEVETMKVKPLEVENNGKKTQEVQTWESVCRVDHGGSEASDGWRWGRWWVVPMIGTVTGDECLSGLFVGEKGLMVGWVMKKNVEKYNYVRVRERGRGIKNERVYQL